MAIDQDLLESYPGNVSHGNSTITALNAGETFTGAFELNSLPDVMVVVRTDQSGVLSMDLSPDGVNVDSTLTFQVPSSGIETPHILVKGPRYYRTRYENNSGSNQSYLRLYTYYGGFNKLTSPLNTVLAQDADAIAVRTIPAELGIPQGLLEGYDILTKFGRNADVDTATVPEDVWLGGGLYTGFPTGDAETVDIFSASTDDLGGSPSGTGAQTVEIFGLDADWAAQTETLTLDGTSLVTSVNTWRRVNRGIVRSAGSGGSNAGLLTCRHTTTTANVFFTIAAGKNRTQVAAYTIPANKTGYLVGLYASLRKEGGATFDRDADMDLYSRPFGEVFQSLRPFGVSNASAFSQKIFGGLTLAQKTDVVLRVEKVSTNDSGISGGFDIILVDG